MDQNAAVAAGWYPDTAQQPPGTLRWWDGSQWTEHLHRPEPAAVAPQQPAMAQSMHVAGLKREEPKRSTMPVQNAFMSDCRIDSGDGNFNAAPRQVAFNPAPQRGARSRGGGGTKVIAAVLVLAVIGAGITVLHPFG